MISQSHLVKVPSNKVKEYHNYFDEYNYARRFIDQMKIYPTANLWVDQHKEPSILYFQIPWINVLAGDHKSPQVEAILDKVETALLFYPNPEWKKVLQERFGDKLEEFTHRTFKSEKLDINHVRKFITPLPDGYHLERVTLETAQYIDEHFHTFSRTWETVEDYVNKGLGYCIRFEDKVVSHAGSLFPFTKHLEIQVDTDPDYRRNGFASIVCAKLIEQSLLNDVIPYWEAHTEISAKIAEKLGFNDPQLYDLFMKTE